MVNIKKIIGIFITLAIFGCATVKTNIVVDPSEEKACNDVNKQVLVMIDQFAKMPQNAGIDSKLTTKYCGLLSPRDTHSGLAYMTLVLTNVKNNFTTESGFLVKFVLNGDTWQIIEMNRLFILTSGTPEVNSKENIGQSL